ncbi:MAG: M56 family metallopeptidase, partial [Planctomycetota bacterium]
MVGRIFYAGKCLVVRGRLAVRWHYWLWLLLLARMVMPWAPESRFSMFSVVPQATKVIAEKQIAKVTPTPSTVVPKPKVTQGVTPKVTNIQENQESVESISTPPQSTQTSTSTGQLSFELIDILSLSWFIVALGFLIDILSLSWFIVALGFATFALACNFRLWRIIKSQRPLTKGKILDLLEDCKTEMRIQTILAVIVSDRVKSPALFGVLRPRLLLPEGMTEMLSREELHYVFLHELAHLKRRDIYLGWFMVVLQVLHWFNPLVWLAFAQMRADRELACDSLVLSTM